MRRTVILAMVAVVVVALDQVTKALAHTPMHNPRYAFGVAGGQTAALCCIALVVLAVFAVLGWRYADRIGAPSWVLVAMVTASASNTVDRLVFGSVRDFIVTPWVIINVADVVIAAGIVTVLGCTTVRLRPNESKPLADLPA
jgi:lipoprotein signal peptidase